MAILECGDWNRAPVRHYGSAREEVSMKQKGGGGHRWPMFLAWNLANGS